MLSPNQKKLLLIVFLTINLLLVGSLVFVQMNSSVHTEMETVQVELKETASPSQEEAMTYPLESDQDVSLGTFFTELLG